MADPYNQGLTRRRLLQTAGTFAVGSVLTGATISAVHLAVDDTIRVALVGCGYRGTGAVTDALKARGGGSLRLVAMADVFQDRLTQSYNFLKQYRDVSAQVDVPPDRRFLGFDAYKKAIDCLGKGDVVIFAAPAAFRWVHFRYAIEKGVHVFMEKPVAVDGPSARKMLALGEEAEAKGLKVGVGLMCRHCVARAALYEQLQNGAIGDVFLLQAWRHVAPSEHTATGPRPKDFDELLYQVRHFHGFLWASGGGYSDFLIHNIDECCWMKGAWPVKAEGAGARHYRGDNIDQNFDTYSVDYTFADGTTLQLECRTMAGCHSHFASYVYGTEGSGIISFNSHSPARPRLFKGQNFEKDNQIWAYGQDEPNPYQLEWNDLIAAIRQNKPYNEVKRGAEASLVAAMGRMAAHTGQLITFDQMLNCEHEFAPAVDQLTMDSPAPLQAGADGKYPVPQPGGTEPPYREF